MSDLVGVWQSKEAAERYVYVMRVEGTRAVAFRCDRRGLRIPGVGVTRYQLNQDGTALKRYRRPTTTPAVPETQETTS